MKKNKQTLKTQIINTTRVRQRNISIICDKQSLNQKSNKKQSSQKKISNAIFKSQKKQTSFSAKKLAEVSNINHHRTISITTKSKNEKQNICMMKQDSKKNITVNKLIQNKPTKPQIKILKVIHISNKKNKQNFRYDNSQIFQEPRLSQNICQTNKIQNKPNEMIEQQKMNQQIYGQFSEKQKKQIFTQLMLVKYYIIQKIAEKRNDNDIDVQTLIQEMNQLLTVQLQKIIQKVLQKNSKSNNNQMKANDREIQNQFKKQATKTPTTQKTQENPCFQQYTFQKKQDPIKEFSLFNTTNQKSNEMSTSHQCQSSLLKKIQLPDPNNLKKTSVKKKITLSIQNELSKTKNKFPQRRISEFNTNKMINSENRYSKNSPRSQIKIKQFNIL